MGDELAPGRRALHGDLALYSVSALVAAGLFWWSGLRPHRAWGITSAGGYGLGALATAALLVRTPRHRLMVRMRAGIALLVFATACLVPLGIGLWLRHEHGGAWVQSEAVVTERAAQEVADGRNPYSMKIHVSPTHQPHLTAVLPYLPLTLAFGVGRVAWPGTIWSDARIAFSLFTVSVLAIALLLWRADPGKRLRVAQVFLVLPTGAIYFATGGDDLPVLALLLLAVVLLDRRRPASATAVAGLAAAMKLIAWPVTGLVLVAALRASPPGSRWRLWLAPLPALALIAGPALAWGIHDYFVGIILFPFGLSQYHSPGSKQSLVAAILSFAPRELAQYGRVAAAALVVTASGAFLLSRKAVRAATPREVAALGGGLLAVVFLSAPAGRLGYWIYPINLLVWSRCFPATNRLAEEGVT
jgi:hypothetical protein